MSASCCENGKLPTSQAVFTGRGNGKGKGHKPGWVCQTVLTKWKRTQQSYEQNTFRKQLSSRCQGGIHCEVLPQQYKSVSQTNCSLDFAPQIRLGRKQWLFYHTMEKFQIVECSPFDMESQEKFDLDIRYTPRLTWQWTGTPSSWMWTVDALRIGNYVLG